MSKDDKNRAIAEWLEPSINLPELYEYGVIAVFDKPSPLRAWVGTHEGAGVALTTWVPVDFFSSEEASALVLEKMPAVELYKHPPDRECSEAGWRCRPDWGLHFAVYHADRKTAIAEAALALIEAQKHDIPRQT